jgi:hypothetical protein
MVKKPTSISKAFFAGLMPVFTQKFSHYLRPRKKQPAATKHFKNHPL